MAAVGLVASGCGGGDSHDQAAAGNSDPPGVAGSPSEEGGLPGQCASICQKTGPLGCPATTDFATCANGCVLLLQAAAAFCPAPVSAYAGCLAAQPTGNLDCAVTGLFEPKAGVCAAELDALNRCGR